MTDTPWPRRLVAATHDVKTEWTRALFDAFGPGGLLAREAPEFGREHLLWALAQLRHTNGRTGLMFTGDTTIADELGYNTNDPPGKRCRDVLTRFGFFTQQGKQGRAAKLRLSVPLELLDDVAGGGGDPDDPAVAEGHRLTGQVQPTATLIEVRQDLLELSPQSTGGSAA